MVSEKDAAAVNVFAGHMVSGENSFAFNHLSGKLILQQPSQIPEKPIRGDVDINALFLLYGLGDPDIASFFDEESNEINDLLAGIPELEHPFKILRIHGTPGYHKLFKVMDEQVSMAYFDRFNKVPYKGKSSLAKFWYFIWHEDSLESWIINIILAFVLIKYIVYPGLGILLATSHPIVAVVSGSMQHGESFGDYWMNAGSWYESHGISQTDFRDFPMHNGFNKGDIMLLYGSKDIEVGDIIVFLGAKENPRPDPIIHRVVAISENGVYQTKGDNYRTNPDPINSCSGSGCLYESDISEGQIIGKAFIRVPYLGYLKIWAVDMACLFGNFQFCIQT